MSSGSRPFGFLTLEAAIGLSGGKGRNSSLNIPRKSWLISFVTLLYMADGILKRKCRF
jgi:hypothetical protein